MNTETGHGEHKPTPAEKSAISNALHQLPRRFWAMLSHNLLWKLLAVVLAVSLWAGLITQDPTLTRERVFNDVPVTVTGSDTLRRNGFIVVSGIEDDSTLVRLKVDVPQREYNSVTTSNYNPRIDLSKITEIGEQTLKISTTSTTTYGTVAEVSPASITVMVDNYITSYRLPVTIHQTGDYPAGYYGSTPTLDPSVVSVSGPESIVSQIARIGINFDVSHLPSQSGLVRTALPLTYEDEDGNLLDSSLVEASSSGVLLQSIVVEQQLYPTKTLDLNTLALTTGTPATGYEVKSVTITPSSVVAAGDETTLDTLDALFIEQAVDVSDMDASFSTEVKIRKPAEITYLSASSVMVSVEIGPVITTKEFTGISLSISGTDDKLSASSETRNVDVSVTGPQLTLNALRSSALSAYVSTTGLTEGTYALPVLLAIDGVDNEDISYSITPQNVSVTLAAQ